MKSYTEFFVGAFSFLGRSKREEDSIELDLADKNFIIYSDTLIRKGTHSMIKPVDTFNHKRRSNHKSMERLNVGRRNRQMRHQAIENRYKFRALGFMKRL